MSISSSRRGLAWQKSTPSRASVSGASASRRARSAPSSAALSAAVCAARSPGAGAAPPTASAVSRSPLPRMKRTGTSSPSRRSSVAAANGPGTASPPTRTTSGPAARGSASTASSASTLPWMSYSASTRMAARLVHGSAPAGLPARRLLLGPTLRRRARAGKAHPAVRPQPRCARLRMPARRATARIEVTMESFVDLYWIPLGAGGHSVRLNGKVFEFLAAARARRPRRDLYHAALVVGLDGARHTIEITPSPDDDRAARGVVATGAVGSRLAGRLRLFRYEVRCWRGGSIPTWPMRSAAPAGSPPTLAPPAGCSTSSGRADAGLGTRRAPRGRDVELQLHGRLAHRPLRAPDRELHPPPGGRAPGWDAGLAVAATEAAGRAAGPEHEAPRRRTSNRPAGWTNRDTAPPSPPRCSCSRPPPRSPRRPRPPPAPPATSRRGRPRSWAPSTRRGRRRRTGSTTGRRPPTACRPPRGTAGAGTERGRGDGRGPGPEPRHDVPLPPRGRQRRRQTAGQDATFTTTESRPNPLIPRAFQLRLETNSPTDPVVRALVNPQGAATSWYAEYGHSTSLRPQDAGAGAPGGHGGRAGLGDALRPRAQPARVLARRRHQRGGDPALRARALHHAAGAHRRDARRCGRRRCAGDAG